MEEEGDEVEVCCLELGEADTELLLLLLLPVLPFRVTMLGMDEGELANAFGEDFNIVSSLSTRREFDLVL